ncbi:FAD/NAD(P)-binding protein [Tessaracoccus rhinocerotis]|uniref:FAD/NAD(P)-binding protein n=1 Tax=Tessaracoccus rhinocerotis TaxID=1689449 RepID=UPI00163D5391|nr:FAD/NAD(P)-binding protein [Tessaracoccus rhinocerotis]
MADSALTVVIVGLGPRGVSLLERIGARGNRELTLHLVDDAQPGAGRLWRTDQDRDMCMNTLAGAVTMFTDDSFSGAGPVVEGPTLWEWCRLAHETITGEPADAPPIPDSHRRAFLEGADVELVAADEAFRAEVAAAGPGSHPSRALFGLYQDWVLRTALAKLGPDVQVVWHRTRATRVTTDDAGRPVVELADGEVLRADAVALALGWLESEPNHADKALAAAVESSGVDVTWVPPDSPIEQDLSGIRAGEPVIVRGFGMGFFDSMSMLTIGRGGRFEPDGERLRYVPSGQEPILHVGSRKGLPFRAKSVYEGLPPAVKLARVCAVDWRARRPLRFTEDFLPLLARDATQAYYETAARFHDIDLDAIIELIDANEPWELAPAIVHLLPDELPPFDFHALLHEHVHPQGRDSYEEFIVDRVASDLAEARLGLDSPFKAGLWEANAARRFLTELAAFDGIDAEGYEGDLREFLSFGGTIGSGPPAFRAAQLLALVDAGLVRFVGPRITVEVGETGFVAHSPLIEGSRVEAPALLDAWVRLHDGRFTQDPIISGLLEQGLAQPFGRLTAHGDRSLGPAFAIDEVTSELIGPAGRHRIHLLGIPSDAARGDTIIAPMPGTDPTMLREIDAAVEAILA